MTLKQKESSKKNRRRRRNKFNDKQTRYSDNGIFLTTGMLRYYIKKRHAFWVSRIWIQLSSPERAEIYINKLVHDYRDFRFIRIAITILQCHKSMQTVFLFLYSCICVRKNYSDSFYFVSGLRGFEYSWYLMLNLWKLRIDENPETEIQFWQTSCSIYFD